MAILEEIQKKFNLPPLQQVVDLVSGPTGKRVEKILSDLLAMSNTKSIQDAKELLELVKELDDKGTLGRLISLLKELKPLTKDKTVIQVVEKLDKIEKLIKALMEEG